MLEIAEPKNEPCSNNSGHILQASTKTRGTPMKHESHSV